MKLGGTIFKAIIRHLNTHGHIISNNSILKILFNFKVDTKDDIRSELQKLLAEEEQVMAKLTKEVEHSALTTLCVMEIKMVITQNQVRI